MMMRWTGFWEMHTKY